MLPDAHIAALTATGGLMLVGIALRLLRIRDMPVGDLLPALLVAPAADPAGRRRCAEPGTYRACPLLPAALSAAAHHQPGIRGSPHGSR